MRSTCRNRKKADLENVLYLLNLEKKIPKLRAVVNPLFIDWRGFLTHHGYFSFLYFPTT